MVSQSQVAGPGLAPGDMTEEEALGAYHTAIYYFVTFHLIFTFFLMNLFIGVMSVSFSVRIM